MTILVKKDINLSTAATSFLQEYLEHIQAVNQKDIYEGLNNHQILKNKFIFKIYQLENLDLAHVDTHFDGKQLQVFANIWNEESTNIGSIILDDDLKSALKQDSYPTLLIHGGPFKEVVTDEYGDDKIVDGVEPYHLTLEIHQSEPRNSSIQKLDTAYHQAFKTENSLVNFAKNLIRCFAVLGLIMGLGFMYFGFLLTGVLVIIAFFGFNLYTLLLADTHSNANVSQQRINP